MQLIGELAQARDINYPLDKSSQAHVYLSYRGNEKQKTDRLSWNRGLDDASAETNKRKHHQDIRNARGSSEEEQLHLSF